jgi:hypothetical protein
MARQAFGGPLLAIIEANSYFNLSRRMRKLRKMVMKRSGRSGRGCMSTVKEVELAQKVPETGLATKVQMRQRVGESARPLGRHGWLDLLK